MAALNELIASLDSRDIEKLFERYHFTESQKLEIAKAEADLRQWKEQSFCLLAPYEEIDARKDGRKGDAYMRLMRSYMDDLRKSETDYSSFSPDFHPRPKYRTILSDEKIIFLSRFSSAAEIQDDTLRREDCSRKMSMSCRWREDKMLQAHNPRCGDAVSVLLLILFRAGFLYRKRNTCRQQPEGKASGART